MPPPPADAVQQPPAPVVQPDQPDAPEAEPPADEAAPPADEEEIVVTGQRLRGQVDSDIPPEIQLDARDIRAFGASTIAELIQALSPQTSSGRGRGGGFPVILVNGRRISSFSELRDLPPEAIERVDILPEEVALRYGYRADQRVVNLVLRRRFNAVTAEATAGMSTAGGRGLVDLDANYLQITGAQRTSFSAQYQNQAALLESQRDIIQASGSGGIDEGNFRTLLPESDTYTLAATHNRMIFGNVSATADGRLVVTNTASLLGLPPNDPASTTPLVRLSDSTNGHLGLGFNGDIAPWRWNLTANFDRVESDTTTDRLAGSPPDTAEQVNQAFTSELVASGPITDLWAGPLNASIKAGAELRSFDSESTRAGTFRETSLSRQRFEGQASFDLPITSTREGVLDAIGDLTANFNVAVEHYSDFGALTTIGGGLNWRPIEAISVIASFTKEEGAPTINQLGDPVIATPNVRVFDFVRGETVDITQISGGNTALSADNRRVINLGINVRPTDNLSIRANYTDNRIDNPIASFPAATAEIEAAFPDRFVRDAGGRLLSIDTRPVNFARSERRQFRWGVDWSAPFGPQPQGGLFGGFGGGGRGGRGRGGGGGAAAPGGGAPAVQNAQGQTPQGQNAEAQNQGGQGQTAQGQGTPAGAQGARPGGRGGFGGRRGGGGRGGFGGRGGGRIQLSLFHTWRLEDSVLIRPGGPELDFLDGSAAGNGGGTPEHLIEARAGVFRDGFGARAEIDWQSGTRVTGVNGSDLSFSPRTTINLRLFADLSAQRDLVRDIPFLRGARVTLSIDNLLDTRINVRDELGQTPLSYQPFLIDPVGRSVRISFRKLFF